MSPAAKRGPPTSGPSPRNWRLTPESHRGADYDPSSDFTCTTVSHRSRYASASSMAHVWHMASSQLLISLHEMALSDTLITLKSWVQIPPLQPSVPRLPGQDASTAGAIGTVRAATARLQIIAGRIEVEARRSQPGKQVIDRLATGRHRHPHDRRPQAGRAMGQQGGAAARSTRCRLRR